MVKSKLEKIIKTLDSNPQIVIVHEDEKKPGEEDGSYNLYGWNIRFDISPRKGLYTVRKLEKFMLSLVPGLRPSLVDDFEEYGSSNEFIHLGGLFYDEKIGLLKTSTKREIIRDVKENLDIPKLKDGEESYNINRSTELRVFPNEDIAKYIRGLVSLDEIKRERPNIQKLIDLIPSSRKEEKTRRKDEEFVRAYNLESPEEIIQFYKKSADWLSMNGESMNIRKDYRGVAYGNLCFGLSRGMFKVRSQDAWNEALNSIRNSLEAQGKLRVA